MFIRYPHSFGIDLPSYSTNGSAGMDIRAAIDSEIILNPGDFIAIPTGFGVEIPEGYEIQVRPRSGFAVSFGITVLNAPGTIDSDFKGEIKVVLVNHGLYPFIIKRGDRIAQLVFAKYERFPGAIILDNMRTGGFGSTGVK